MDSTGSPEVDDTGIQENHPLFTFRHRLGHPPRADRLRELARAPTEKGKRRRLSERDERSWREARVRARKSRDKEKRLKKKTKRVREGAEEREGGREREKAATSRARTRVYRSTRERVRMEASERGSGIYI